MKRELSDTFCPADYRYSINSESSFGEDVGKKNQFDQQMLKVTRPLSRFRLFFARVVTLTIAIGTKATVIGRGSPLLEMVKMNAAFQKSMGTLHPALPP